MPDIYPLPWTAAELVAKLNSLSDSVTNAGNSATTAGQKATESATSASAANTSETNSKTSETNSKASETAAASSATAANNSATSAATSATNASNSATAASNSATAAATAKTGAETARDQAAQTLANSDLTNRIGTTGPASCRNKIRNPRFMVNQRNVSGTVTLASGAFGHDGWKGGASGCTYTFSTTQGRTTLTISAGSLVQTVDGLDLAAGTNTHTLSWGGTCQGKIGSGSYGASGVTGLATGGTNISVEFNTGTLYQPQLEIGSAVSQFEYVSYPEDFARCYYYLPSLSSPTSANAVILCGGYSTSASGFVALVDFGLPVRGKPTGVTVAGSFDVNVGSSSANVSSLTFSNATSERCGVLIAALATAVTPGQSGSLYFVAGSYSKILFTGLEI